MKKTNFMRIQELKENRILSREDFISLITLSDPDEKSASIRLPNL